MPGKSLILPILLLAFGFWLGRAYFTNRPIEDLLVASTEQARDSVIRDARPSQMQAKSASTPLPLAAERQTQEPPATVSKPVPPADALNVTRLQTAHKPKTSADYRNPAAARDRSPSRATDYRELRRELLSNGAAPGM
jgi:hypothetical protein